MKLSTVVIIALCIFPSGCAIKVKGPDIKIKAPIEIEGGGKGGFCPPGQAKKGNC
jgi:hypothetical protein